jgi:hypothetical protein
MAGSNQSVTNSQFIGVRCGSGETNQQGVSVGLPLIYRPARYENGKRYEARAEFTVFHNDGWARRQGREDQGERFRIWAYAGRAESLCRWLSPGREISLITARHSYQGLIYGGPGQPLNGPDGQPLTTIKQADKVQSYHFGPEADKWIGAQVQSGMRPMNWSVPNHPDYELWRQMLRLRRGLMWDGQSNTFGFARIALPQGAQVDTDYYQKLHRTLTERYQQVIYAMPSVQQMGGQAPAAPAAPGAHFTNPAPATNVTIPTNTQPAPMATTAQPANNVPGTATVANGGAQANGQGWGGGGAPAPQGTIGYTPATTAPAGNY